MKSVMMELCALAAVVLFPAAALAQGQPLDFNGKMPEGVEIQRPSVQRPAAPQSAQASPYVSNGMGGYNGTGKAAGSGWRPNGFGGLIGTGNNSGHRCSPNGKGGYVCK